MVNLLELTSIMRFGSDSRNSLSNLLNSSTKEIKLMRKTISFMALANLACYDSVKNNMNLNFYIDLAELRKKHLHAPTFIDLK